MSDDAAIRSNLTEAQAERMADRTIMQRLRTDSAYQHAADAFAQAAREDEIEAEVWADIEARYDVR